MSTRQDDRPGLGRLDTCHPVNQVEAEYQAAKRRALGLGKRRLKQAEAALRARDDLSDLDMATLRAYRWVLTNWGVRVAALRGKAA